MRRRDDIFEKLNTEKPLGKSSSGLDKKMPEKSTFDLLLEKQQSSAKKKPTATRGNTRPAKRNTSKAASKDLDIFSAKSRSSTRAKDALHDIDYGKPEKKAIAKPELSKVAASTKKVPKTKRTAHTDALKFAEKSAALDYNEDKLNRAMKGTKLGAEQEKEVEAKKKTEQSKRGQTSNNTAKKTSIERTAKELEPPISKKQTVEKLAVEMQEKQNRAMAQKSSQKPIRSSISTSAVARTSDNKPKSGIKKVFRHENKYYINYKDHMVLQTALSSVMRLDSNADEYGGYHIRSLYFDDIYETALTEKIAGSDNRCKYRIRIYNYSDGIIKLEKKQKRGKFIKKTSMNLTRDECDSIIAGDSSFLLEKPHKLAKEFYLQTRTRLLKPKVVVDYWREAYVYPVEDVRVTFDIDLKGSTMLTDIFDPNMPVLPVFDNGIMVLEVKFNKYLPEAIKCALNSVGAAKRSAISKYVLCRKYD